MRSIAELSGHATYRADRGRWVVDIRHDGRRIKGYGADPADAARDWAAKAYPPPVAHTGPTIAAYLVEWWQVQADLFPNPETRKSYASAQAHINAGLGDRHFDELTVTILQRWVNDLSKQLAPAYCRTVRTRFQSLLQTARGDRLLSVPPAELEGRVRWPSVKPVRYGREHLPVEVNVAAVLAHWAPRNHVALQLARWTGMRIGEVCGLTVDRVDIDGGVLTVDRQLKANPTRLTQVKTFNPRRVHVPLWLTAAIADHLAVYSPGRASRIDQPLVDPAERFVLSNRFGQPLTPMALQRTLRYANGVAGVQGVTMHKFRHEYLSGLVNAGIPLRTVQAISGHKSMSSLIRYLHEPEDDELRRVVIDALPNQAPTGGSPQLPPNFPPHGE